MNGSFEQSNDFIGCQSDSHLILIVDSFDDLSYCQENIHYLENVHYFQQQEQF